MEFPHSDPGTSGKPGIFRSESLDRWAKRITSFNNLAGRVGSTVNLSRAQNAAFESAAQDPTVCKKKNSTENADTQSMRLGSHRFVNSTSTDPDQQEPMEKMADIQPRPMELKSFIVGPGLKFQPQGVKA